MPGGRLAGHTVTAVVVKCQHDVPKLPGNGPADLVDQVLARNSTDMQHTMLASRQIPKRVVNLCKVWVGGFES